MFDAIAAVEAAYAPASTDAEWRQGVLHSLKRLDDGHGVILASTASSSRGLVCTGMEGTASERLRNALRGAIQDRACDGSALDLPALETTVGHAVARLGLGDVLHLHGAVDEERSFGAYVPLATARALPVDTVRRLRLVGLHLAAGRRAREGGPAIPSRVLDPTVRVPNGDERRALWEGLVGGRWSLVARFERDGRRYLVARRNPPAAIPLRRLTDREARVVVLASAAPSQKYIAYTLGISDAIVSRHMSMAMLKLGVTTRTDLFSIVRTLGIVDDFGEASARRSA